MTAFFDSCVSNVPCVDPLAVLAIAGSGLLIAGIIKGATGLGYASCALPFLVMAFGVKASMNIIILPALATNFSLAFATGHVRETLARFRWLYLAMPPGIVLGIYLLNRVSQSVSVRVFAGAIIGYAILALAKPQYRLPSRFEQPLQWPIGFLNGVVTGMTGAQVMPLFPYVMALQLDADRTVQTVNLAVMIASTSLAIGLFGTGTLTPGLFAASLAALLPALVGVELGISLRRRIPVQNFRKLTLSTMLLLGTMMLLR